MKALFLGGHIDEELCFAGTILSLKSKYEIDYWACHPGFADHKEFFNSMEILGCNGDILNQDTLRNASDFLYRIREQYDIVFTHSITDRHPMHRMVAEESIRVFNQSLLTYIGPWNGNEDPNYFVELSEEQLDKKIAALSCYKSQAHRKYMDPDFIRAWGRYNGIKCGKLYAEGFKVVRLVQSL